MLLQIYLQFVKYNSTQKSLLQHRLPSFMQGKNEKQQDEDERNKLHWVFMGHARQTSTIMLWFPQVWLKETVFQQENKTLRHFSNLQTGPAHSVPRPSSSLGHQLVFTFETIFLAVVSHWKMKSASSTEEVFSVDILSYELISLVPIHLF